MSGNPSGHYETCEICDLGGHVCPGCASDIPHEIDNIVGACAPCREELRENDQRESNES